MTRSWHRASLFTSRLRRNQATILIGISLCIDVSFAQSRMELIGQERTAKQAHLSPEGPPKPEQIIVRAQRSLPYRLLTGNVGGFGVGAGSIMPGSGFAIGPQYQRTGLLAGQLIFTAEARASLNKSYIGSLDFSFQPDVVPGARFDFTVVHRTITETPYYGPGPMSRKSGRSDYLLEDTNVELRPLLQVFKRMTAGAIGSYLAVNIGPGRSNQYISAERQYLESSTPGIDRQANFWRGGGFLQFDWRDRAESPTSGGKYSAQYVRFLDKTRGQYSFFRLDLAATHYIPFFNRTHVIALGGFTSLTSAGYGQRVPFYLQPRLGGPDSLRGYRFDRFYGNNSSLLTAEYHWEASPILEMSLFADGGKVFDRWEQWNYHRLQSDVGFGISLKKHSQAVFTINTGFSHEGFQIWFRANSLL